jgi:hypothetical protein
MHSLVHQWATDWGIPQHAAVDLLVRLGVGYEPTKFVELEGWSESAVQSRVRLEAAKNDILPWRNNVGALQDDTGRVVRYGLCNDTKELNTRVKSSDLIGIKKTWITPEMVGTYIGQFWAREVKEYGWVYTGADREPAQLKFGQIVTAWGGDFKFTTGEI